MERILVLGGSGFIGRYLVSQLISDYSVVVADRVGMNVFDNGGIDYHEFDFLNQEDYSKILSGVDTVVHLVSTNLPHDGVHALKNEIEQNVFGTIRLLEGMKPFVKKILFVSSGGTVYGQNTEKNIETSLKEPISTYGLTKSMIEDVLHLYRVQEGFSVQIARLANPYGYLKDYNKKQGLIPIVTHKLLHNEPITIWGDGNNVRDYIYIDDAVNALCKMIAASDIQGEFNVGTGVGYSINQIIKKISQRVGKTAKVEYKPARVCDVATNMLDVSNIEKSFGWTPQISLDQGIDIVTKQFLDHER